MSRGPEDTFLDTQVLGTIAHDGMLARDCYRRHGLILLSKEVGDERRGEGDIGIAWCLKELYLKQKQGLCEREEEQVPGIEGQQAERL